MCFSFGENEESTGNTSISPRHRSDRLENDYFWPVLIRSYLTPRRRYSQERFTRREYTAAFPCSASRVNQPDDHFIVVIQSRERKNGTARLPLPVSSSLVPPSVPPTFVLMKRQGVCAFPVGFVKERKILDTRPFCWFLINFCRVSVSWLSPEMESYSNDGRNVEAIVIC